MEWYSSVRASHVASVEEVTAEFRALVPRITALPELERDVDGLDALERIAESLNS